MADRHEYWRIIRFAVLPGNQVARLDKKRNILVVDRGFFDMLPPHLQSRVLNTDENLNFGHGTRPSVAVVE